MFQMRSFSELIIYDTCYLLKRQQSSNINRYISSYDMSLNDLRIIYNEHKPISYLLQQMKAKKKEYEEDGITTDSICEIKACGGFIFKKDYNLLVKKNCKNAKSILSFLETHFIFNNETRIKKMKLFKRQKIYRSRINIL